MSAECRPSLCARTDANGAGLLTSDIDERDHEFLTGERTEEGFFWIRGGLDCAIARGLAYAPYADLLWCETSHPDLDEARHFAEAIHGNFPGKLLAYNVRPRSTGNGIWMTRRWPSFNGSSCAMGLQIPVRYPGRVSTP